MRIMTCLSVVSACLVFGCGHTSKFHNGDYARVNVTLSLGTWCFDSKDSLSDWETAELEHNTDKKSDLALIHSVAWLHPYNRVKFIEQDDQFAKVQISTGQECWYLVN